MCGRFSFAFTKKIIEERFDITVSEDYSPRYNCSPSQYLYIISNKNQRFLDKMKWGLIPFWAKNKSVGNKFINAKAETIQDKPLFRNAFQKRRCLVPADSFYEWSSEKEKTPYRFFMKNEQPFCMAGIWEIWHPDQDDSIISFSIITTEANEIVRPFHNRMPVILEREDEAKWLYPDNNDILIQLLKPYDSEQLAYYRISTLVNSPKNDIEEIHHKIL